MEVLCGGMSFELPAACECVWVPRCVMECLKEVFFVHSYLAANGMRGTGITVCRIRVDKCYFKATFPGEKPTSKTCTV